MRQAYISQYFRRRGYIIADSPEAGEIIVYNPNGFARIFNSYRAAYDFYFMHKTRRSPPNQAETKPGRKFLAPDGLTDEQRIETCRQMAEDARAFLMASNRLPSTLYLESYRFCVMTKHIRAIARRHDIVEEIRQVAFWAFGD